MRKINWTRVLTILLTVLAAYAVLYITGTVLGRFRHVIVIFVLGAMTAYVLSPLVRRLEVVCRLRWLAIVLSYAMLAGVLLLLGVMLFTPFVQQSQSLIDNLHTPASSSLQSILRVQCDAQQVERDLRGTTSATLCANSILPPGSSASAALDVTALSAALKDLQRGVILGPIRQRYQTHISPGRQPPNPKPQTQVPPSYVKPLERQVNGLQRAYQASLTVSGPLASADVAQAIAHSRHVVILAENMYSTVSVTPILLLRSQTWLDQHGIAIDLHSRFGDAARQLSNQGTLILNNAVTILQETANTLLNLTLILIIGFYFLSDGGRLIRRGVDLVPSGYRDQVWYFVTSLDRVLGGYIRGQLFLSILAGVLGGAGAAALGVPYPLLIGILTGLLEAVPVIGPMVALVPAVAVSLFFEPVITTVLLLVWNIIFQQLVTNILGPRIMGIAVGIHPLEAMLAVLVGYPLAGFLGAFLAVPVAGILHIVIRELYGYFALGQALPTASPEESDEAPGVIEAETGPAPGAERRAATG